MNLLYYLAEANLYLAGFYLFYLLLLRNLTWYHLNRFYLLSTSIAAFIIPLLQLGVLKPTPQISVDFGAANVNLYPIDKLVQPPPVNHHVLTMSDDILMIYSMVTIALLVNLAVKIVRLSALTKQGDRLTNKGYTLIKLKSEGNAFSFFGYLFIDQNLSTPVAVLEHEKVHIRQKHSWDVLFTEVLKAFNWFNPFVYLLQKSLTEVHEFIADQFAVVFENGADSYAGLLISNMFGRQPAAITNSFFNKNQLKRRLIMLYQKKSGKAARLTYLFALPLIGGMLCLSTMAFTAKDYAWVDLMPASFKTHSTALATKFKFLLKNKGAQTKLTNAGQMGHVAVLFKSFQNDTAVSKKPIIIVDGKFNGTEKQNGTPGTDMNISDLSKIDPATIKSIDVLKGENAVALYGPKGVNGVIIVTTKNGVGQQNATNRPMVIMRDTLKSDMVFSSVEVVPAFPGGEKSFYEFLSSNIKYPKSARDSNVTGRVFVAFIVEKDGSLSNFMVKRSPAGSLSDEALRVLRLSPKWTPGMQNGNPVRVSYIVPINFNLSSDKNSDSIKLARINAPKKYMLSEVVVSSPSADNNPVLTAVEISPDFPGGEKAFGAFLAKTTKYPKLAFDNKIQGRAFINFIVEKDGSLSNIKIVRNPGSGLGEEAVRAISLSPKWTPGYQNGQPVRVSYTVPVNFSLSK